MNEKAAELGLETTHYADPSGLLSDNVSSAYDMARLITHASQDERISSIMRTHGVHGVHGGKRPITFHSTNHLLRGGDVDVRAGKTGFISKAGYCLATLLRLPQSSQRGRGRRLRRALQRRPLHGIAEPVQLGVVEGLDAVRRQAGHAAAAAVTVNRGRR